MVKPVGLIGLAVCLLPQVAAGQAPSCGSGGPSKVFVESAWVEPQPVETVRRQVLQSLTSVGYTVTAGTSGDSLVTAPRYTWPNDPVILMWRNLIYPGAQVSIRLEPVEVWTRIHLTTRLLCSTRQKPPAGYPQDVDFDQVVVGRTSFEVREAISRPLGQMKVRVFAQNCSTLPGGDRTIDICRQIARANPRDPEAHRQYAMALARFYRGEKAWEPLKRVFELEGEKPMTFVRVGEAFLAGRQYQDALKLYERGVALWPRDATMAQRKGMAALFLNQFDVSARSEQVALGLDSTMTDAHWQAAAAANNLGRPDEAQLHCRSAVPLLQDSLKQRAKDGQAWIGLAYCAYLLGDHRSAVSYYERAVLVDYSNARAPFLETAIKRSVAIAGDQPPAALPQ
jgi:tetratricopeptide (TPR) repeat protein